MDRVDATRFSQGVDQRHEDDDGRDWLDEITDNREQQNHHDHDQMRVSAGDVSDPFGNDHRAAQIGQKPAKGRRRSNCNQRQSID